MGEIADSSIIVTPGTGASIDTRTEATNGDHRQVITVGDPSVNAQVATVDAQNRLAVSQVDTTATGTITTQNLVPAGTATAGSAVLSGALNGMSSAAIQVTGVYTGGLSLQATVDNATWVTFGGAAFTSLATGTAAATIPSAGTGIFQADVTGFRQVRVTGLAAMTGTATVTIQLSNGAGIVGLDTSLPSGASRIGAVTLATPNGFASGFYPVTSPYGSLSVALEPTTIFQDSFDAVGIDTANRWATAGTVVPTQPAGGAVLVNPGTAASASSSLASIAAIPLSSLMFFTAVVQLEGGTIATGNHRFWGLGTQPGTWTALLPLQDAIGFEVDTSGVLRASIYSAGTRVFTQVLTAITDGFPHLYCMYFRPGTTFWLIDNTEIPLNAAPANSTPSIQTLPFRMHSINGTSTTTGTPTMTSLALAMTDLGRNAAGISDGSYPWRRATVDAVGALRVRDLQAAAIAAPASWTVTTAGLSNVVAAGASRTSLLLVSFASARVYLRFDATIPTVALHHWFIDPGERYEVPVQYAQLAVSMAGSAAGGYVLAGLAT